MMMMMMMIPMAGVMIAGSSAGARSLAASTLDPGVSLVANLSELPSGAPGGGDGGQSAGEAAGGALRRDVDGEAVRGRSSRLPISSEVVGAELRASDVEAEQPAMAVNPAVAAGGGSESAGEPVPAPSVEAAAKTGENSSAVAASAKPAGAAKRRSSAEAE